MSSIIALSVEADLAPELSDRLLEGGRPLYKRGRRRSPSSPAELWSRSSPRFEAGIESFAVARLEPSGFAKRKFMDAVVQHPYPRVPIPAPKPAAAAAARRPTREEAEAAVRTLIAWAGDNPQREGLLDTPKR